METIILKELNTTRQTLSNSLALFSATNFNIVPFSGSWTAGQVTEHIFKSIKGVPELLGGPSIPTHRDPNQNTPNIRAMFLDFSTKMKSPEFILPSDTPKDYSLLCKKVEDTIGAIADAAEKIDDTCTVANFEFPGSGPLTRIELLNFISVHTQRHAHQLTEISKHFQ